MATQPSSLSSSHTSGCPSLVALSAMVLLLVLVSSSAITGGWIYDDFAMASHPLSDGWDDAFSTFTRNSNDYLNQDNNETIMFGGFTYRPLSMFSLIFTQALFGIQVLAHHIVSLLLHVAAMCGLLLFTRTHPARISWTSCFLVCAAALHPAMCEAWYWINGRSDLLAGVFLVSLALVLKRWNTTHATCANPTPLRLVKHAPLLFFSGGVCVTAGLLSKITFLPAAAFLIAALCVPTSLDKDSQETPLKLWITRLTPWILVSVLALASFVALRSLSLLDDASSSHTSVLSNGFEWIAYFPRLVALAIESIAFPIPRTMRLLAWELAQPWGGAAYLSLAICILGMGYIALKKDFRTLFLLSGAMVCILPTALVTDFFWLGFDRYLYLPVLLIVVACAPLLNRWEQRPHAAQKSRLFFALALFLIAGLTTSNYMTSRAYRGHEAFVSHMMSQRPQDPTGFIMSMSHDISLNQRRRAVETLRKTPRHEHLPAPVAHELARIFLDLGIQAQAVRLIETAHAQHPNNIFVLFDLLAVRQAQGRWDDVFSISTTLLASPIGCRATFATLRQWVQDPNAAPPNVKPRLQSLLSSAPCSTTP